MKTYNAIRAEFDGTITAILVNSGDAVEEDDVIMKNSQAVNYGTVNRYIQ